MCSPSKRGIQLCAELGAVFGVQSCVLGRSSVVTAGNSMQCHLRSAGVTFGAGSLLLSLICPSAVIKNCKILLRTWISNCKCPLVVSWWYSVYERIFLNILCINTLELSNRAHSIRREGFWADSQRISVFRAWNGRGFTQFEPWFKLSLIQTLWFDILSKPKSAERGGGQGTGEGCAWLGRGDRTTGKAVFLQHPAPGWPHPRAHLHPPVLLTGFTATASRSLSSPCMPNPFGAAKRASPG